ncbi:recombinase family protein [Hymenobacter sp.]|uniref:recombinase family protein n=1 Tax=Hymenobacter sp. TaxID=1898978 RepID=UPI00286B08B7|nr:recombinase family protein [Hymenobacter sp.]
MKEYVSYLRVSTTKQGNSGLGLESQRQAVESFVRETPLLAEYVEVESGKKNHRPQLIAAIAHAKALGATLLIAKLDRLSRNASFIFKLRDTGVDFVCCDMPDVNTLTVGIFAVMAQHEREMISKRTTEALAAKKANGTKLGKPENLTSAAAQKGSANNQQNAHADENNRKATAHILLLKEKGFNYLQIAQKLNNLTFKTRRGKAFGAEQVKRLFLRATAETVAPATVSNEHQTYPNLTDQELGRDVINLFLPEIDLVASDEECAAMYLPGLAVV